MRAPCRRASSRPRRQQVAVDVPGLRRQREGDAPDAGCELDCIEHVFYTPRVGVEYREEPCRSALNRVKGMPFDWSLNPYMGCVHQCTFCYVRAFEKRADRPFDDRYGQSIRVKVNVVEVLRRELARPSWRGEPIAIGAATDPYQPAEGRWLTRGCLGALAASNPFSLITRGPMVVRDVDVLQGAAQRADVSVNFSVPTLDREVAQDGARDAAAAAPPRVENARRRGDQGRRRHGPDPAGALRPAGAARRGRQGRPRRRRDPRLVQRAFLRPDASTSRRWPTTGRSCCRCTSGCTPVARTSRAGGDWDPGARRRAAARARRRRSPRREARPAPSPNSSLWPSDPPA